ncbi:MAG: hypothetical protein ACQERS_14965 [Bacteroidota bacterium]
MKSISYVSIISVSLVILFSKCEKEPNPSDPVDFPDHNFIDALIDAGANTNGTTVATHEYSVTLGPDVTMNQIMDFFINKLYS